MKNPAATREVEGRMYPCIFFNWIKFFFTASLISSSIEACSGSERGSVLLVGRLEKCLWHNQNGLYKGNWGAEDVCQVLNFVNIDCFSWTFCGWWNALQKYIIDYTDARSHASYTCVCDYTEPLAEITMYVCNLCLDERPDCWLWQHELIPECGLDTSTQHIYVLISCTLDSITALFMEQRLKNGLIIFTF